MSVSNAFFLNEQPPVLRMEALRKRRERVLKRLEKHTLGEFRVTDLPAIMRVLGIKNGGPSEEEIRLLEKRLGIRSRPQKK